MKDGDSSGAVDRITKGEKIGSQTPGGRLHDVNGELRAERNENCDVEKVIDVDEERSHFDPVHETASSTQD